MDVRIPSKRIKRINSISNSNSEFRIIIKATNNGGWGNASRVCCFRNSKFEFENELQFPLVPGWNPRPKPPRRSEIRRERQQHKGVLGEVVELVAPAAAHVIDFQHGVECRPKVHAE